MNYVNFNKTRAKITAIFSPQLVQNEMVFDKSGTLVTSVSIESYNNHRPVVLVMMVHHKSQWPRVPKRGPGVARLSGSRVKIPLGARMLDLCLFVLCG